VEAILADLGIKPEDHDRIIEVWNKLDLLDENARLSLTDAAARRRPGERPFIVSAVTGQGIDELLEAIENKLARGRSLFRVVVAPEDGQGLHWLYENAEVLNRAAQPDGTTEILLRIAPEKIERLIQRFPDAKRAEDMSLTPTDDGTPE
jgi:GTP-binding protein HflX